MDDLKKLGHVIDHWLEHNAEHVKTYLEWAGRADMAGRVELSDILRQIAYEAERLERLLKHAKEAAS
jgi:hypothetical protein